MWALLAQLLVGGLIALVVITLAFPKAGVSTHVPACDYHLEATEGRPHGG